MNRQTPASRRGSRGLAIAVLALLLGLNWGCSQEEVDTTYGTSSGASLNGTGAFAALLSKQGHQVRFARSLTAELANWADAIVRFAAVPGPPDHQEADWFVEWLEGRPNRDLVYVVRDYDGEADYWEHVLNGLPAATDGGLRARAESRRDRARHWPERLPAKAKDAADDSFWFAVEKAVGAPATCKSLGGNWGADLDAAEVALPLHQPIAPGTNNVLLSGDGHAVVVEWHAEDGGNVLVLASGSFVLNLPMAIPGRRPLAEQTANWIGGRPRRIAFVSGSSPFDESGAPPSLIEWIAEDSTALWVFMQLFLFGVIACLARAPILGRPRSNPPSGVDRPAAHAEALGALLERGRNADAARKVLAAYRRWRFPHAPSEANQGEQ